MRLIDFAVSCLAVMPGNATGVMADTMARWVAG